jgi:hypothetical protein
MNKTSTIERIYALGNYQNIKITDTVADIPQEVLEDNLLMDGITSIQLLNTELTYRKYLAMTDALPQNATNERLRDILSEVREEHYQQFLARLNQPQEI